jgi:hypothetical protein
MAEITFYFILCYISYSQQLPVGSTGLFVTEESVIFCFSPLVVVSCTQAVLFVLKLVSAVLAISFCDRDVSDGFKYLFSFISHMISVRIKRFAKVSISSLAVNVIGRVNDSIAFLASSRSQLTLASTSAFGKNHFLIAMSCSCSFQK